MDMNRSTMGIAAGVAAGSLLVCYCLFSDWKRRSEPDCKRKVSGSPRGESAFGDTDSEASCEMGNTPQRCPNCSLCATCAAGAQGDSYVPIAQPEPDMTLPFMTDGQSIIPYFLRQIQIGENLIESGQYNSGADHLANAVIACDRPTRVMEVMRKNLPPSVFHTLVRKLQGFGRRDIPNRNPFTAVRTDLQGAESDGE